MRKIIKLILIFFYLTSTAQAGVTKFGAGFSRSFEDYKNFEYTDSPNFEDDFKTVSLNATHFFNNGLNISVGTNRLLNHKFKRKAIQSDVQLSYEYQSFVDYIAAGYRINKLNTSLVVANVILESRAYNNYFDKQEKKSAIVPALNLSYDFTLVKGLDLVPSLSFYRSKELGITRGVLANINFMF